MNKYITISLLFILAAGCSTHKQIERRYESTSADSASYSVNRIEASRIDSLRAIITKHVTEKSDNQNITIERGNPEVRVEPFKITAAFTIDTSAKGDTLRMVSIEKDSVRFQVFYDKKSGQAVAQIEGKGRTIKTPFEKISITNATVTKSMDSNSDVKAGSVTWVNAASSDSSLSRKATQKSTEKSELTRKQTGISNIVWGLVALALVFLILSFVFRKAIFK